MHLLTPNHPLYVKEFSDLLTPLFKKNEFPKKLGVAVSGGADSMALCLLTKKWCEGHDIQLVALTVDHHLRAESTQESLWVKETLKKQDISHITLDWIPNEIPKRLQETARLKRYELLSRWCQDHGVKHLLTAHHLWDQFETFMMRLSKGSGLDGLCAIRPCTEIFGIEVLRPLLTIHPDRLKATLNEHQIPWVHDPSNDNVHFERVRWRKNLSVLSSLGLTPEIIQQTISKLCEDHSFLQNQVRLFENEHVIYQDMIALLKKTKWDELPLSFKSRIFQQIFFRLAPWKYPVSKKSMALFLEKLDSLPFGKSLTLRHCMIKSKRHEFVITLEERPIMSKNSCNFQKKANMKE